MKRIVLKEFLLCLTIFLLVNPAQINATSIEVKITLRQEKENNRTIKLKEIDLLQKQEQERAFWDESVSSYVIEKILPIKRFSQVESYFCGPASVEMLLWYKGIGGNENQYDFARDLKTTREGTSIYNMSEYLKNRTGFNYVTQSIYSKPISNIQHTINSNYGVIYNVKTRELNSQYSFNSGHYIVGIGYRFESNAYTPDQDNKSKLLGDGNLESVPIPSLYYYLDPWWEAFAVGTKKVTGEKLIQITKNHNGLYIW